MTNFLVHKFIKNYENYTDAKVRGNYGILSSAVGIACNILLFLLKYILGTLTHSISIVSDGFNNLSDSASCIIAMFGYKMASKPADKDHPFGHGRMEYLISLVISAIILFVGAELFSSSVKKILEPERLVFRWIVLVSLVCSVLLKLWMAAFNFKLGKKLESSTMLATAKDSTNDVFVTIATIIALVASIFTQKPVDGIMGVLVSVFVLWSGFSIIKDTVDQLLGKPADPALIERLKQEILTDPKILGVHDFMIHNYGPGQMIGSVHVEVSAKENILEIHDRIDQIEHRIYNENGIVMTIHMDPMVLDDAFTNECKEMLSDILKQISPRLSFHDFRVITGPTHTNLVFDLVVPFGFKMKNSEIREQLDALILEKSEKRAHQFYTSITFDKDYVAENEE